MSIFVDGATSYGRNVLRGVMRYANAQRRWVIQSETRPIAANIASLRRSDGVIAAGVSDELVRVVRKKGNVFIHCSASADLRYGPGISLDDQEAGRLAAEHLLDCRLERLAFYGFEGWKASVKRETGFAEALERRGFSYLKCPVHWEGLEVHTTKAERALTKWVQHLSKPVGIFAADDSAANHLAAVCLRADVGVPDEVAIIGVNNDDLLCDSAWPPLTSVEGDFGRVGYVAALMMEKLLAGEQIPMEQRAVRVPPLGVVKRLSTDVLAVDDPQLAQAVRYIREHACDPDAMQQVLRHTAVGRRWLERQFTKKLNRTPHDEILRVRMETAKRLLLQPGLQIDDIAVRCGLSSAQSLCRAFAGFFKITPAAFRRRSLAAG